MKHINFFNTFTAPYAIIFHIIMFFIMNEYRYPRKKAAYLTAVLNLPVIAVTIFCYIVFGSERGGQYALLFYIIPQIAVCLYLSAHRDGRVLSTYFFVLDVNIFIIQISNLIDCYTTPESHMAMFFIRLIAYPIVLTLMVLFLSKPYRKAMNVLHTGWNTHVYISGILTLMLIVVFNFPTTLAKRPYDIPTLVLTFGVILLTDLNYIETLMSQREYYREQEMNRFLELQMRMMQQKIDQTAETAKNISIYQHDLRHILVTIGGMLSSGQTEAARAYIEENTGAIETNTVKRWCGNPTLNAMFSAYFAEAEKQGIHIDTEINLTDIPDAETAALSLVFANAIENAIHAVTTLPEEKRIIRVRALTYPRMMFSVSNPYSKEIMLDDDGIPVSHEADHGIGIRSILAYCEKNFATYDFKIKDGWFTIRIVKEET